MRKKILKNAGIYLLCAILTAGQLGGPDTEFTEKILKFEENWYPFLVEYFGCSENKPISPENCVVRNGRFNLGRFRKAKSVAKDIFRD